MFKKVKEVDLILKNQGKFKVLVTIGFNWLSSFHTFLWYIAPYATSYLLPVILKIPDNGRKRNLNLLLLIFKKLTDMPLPICKIHRRKKLKGKGLPTMVGR